MGAPLFEPTREVRFGVVLYGGVSLAIYMSGVAQELLAMVRATVAGGLNAAGQCECRLTNDELTGTEAVYRRIAQTIDDKNATDDSPVRVRFVVDIISGSSAGGLNGVFLAKALSTGKSLDSLNHLWIGEGDLDLLINDSKSVDGYPGLTKVDKPESLLNGDRMYALLLQALDRLDDEAPAGAPDPAKVQMVDDIDLWVTTTDLGGFDLPLTPSDPPMTEKKHRTVLHFAFGEEQDEDGTRNDFTAGFNPFLAFAGRATSSFPFAFRPIKLRDIDPIVRASRHRDDDPSGQPPSSWARWKPFFPDYARAHPVVDYTGQNFSDGGDIDNMPFGYVIDTLPKRRSTVPVDRKVLFVDPIPSRPGAAASQDRPDVVSSVIQAVSLGREETIREDLQRIDSHNRTVEHLRWATAAVTETLEQGPGGAPASAEDWLAEGADEAWAQGPGYVAYLRLRFEMLVEEYANSIAGVTWLDESTTRTRALHDLVSAWAMQRYGYPGPGDGAIDDEGRPGKEFLRSFDISFRLRRLMFVAQRANAIYAEDPAGRDDVMALKDALNLTVDKLATYIPALRSRSRPEDLTTNLAALRLTTEDLDSIGKATDRAAAATAILGQDGVMAAFDSFAANIDTFLKAVFDESRRTVLRQLDPVGGSVQAELRGYYDRYARYDEVLYPPLVAAGEVGELRTVEVLRVSPDDSIKLLGPEPPPKLAGVKLGHFGGFLEEGWRRNDIMWGRLDAAERLINATLPAADLTRAALVDEAHYRIIKEAGTAWQPAAETRGPIDTSPTAAAARGTLLKRFSTEFKVPTEVDRPRAAHLAGRASAVIGKMLATLEGDQKSPYTTVMLWVSRIIWGIAELATPQSLGTVLLKHWANLIALVAFAMLLIGAVAQNDSLVTAGWIVLGLVFLTRAIAGTLAAAVRGQWSVVRLLVIAVAAVAIVFLAGLGLRDTARWLRDQACDTDVSVVHRFVPGGCPASATTDT